MLYVKCFETTKLETFYSVRLMQWCKITIFPSEKYVKCEGKVESLPHMKYWRMKIVHDDVLTCCLIQLKLKTCAAVRQRCVSHSVTDRGRWAGTQTPNSKILPLHPKTRLSEIQEGSPHCLSAEGKRSCGS